MKYFLILVFNLDFSQIYRQRLCQVMGVFLTLFYHPPSCITPLEVDQNEQGKDGDHNIPPINFPNTGPKRKKKIIITRPLHNSKIEKFGIFITSHNWDEVFSEYDVNTRVANFHNTIFQGSIFISLRKPSKYLHWTKSV